MNEFNVLECLLNALIFRISYQTLGCIDDVLSVIVAVVCGNQRDDCFVLWSWCGTLQFGIVDSLFDDVNRVSTMQEPAGKIS